MSNIKDNQSSSNVDTKISGDDSNQTNANNVDQTNETSFLKGISQTVLGAVVDVANGVKDTATEIKSSDKVQGISQIVVGAAGDVANVIKDKVTEIKSSDAVQGMSQAVEGAANVIKDTVTEIKSSDKVQGISQAVVEASVGAVNAIKGKFGFSNETTEVDKTKNVDNADKVKENAAQTPSDNNNKATDNEKNNNKADESTPKTFSQKLSSASSATIGAVSSKLSRADELGTEYVGGLGLKVVDGFKNTASAVGNGFKNTASAVGNGVKNAAETTGNGVFKIISSINPFASRQEEKKEESVQK